MAAPTTAQTLLAVTQALQSGLQKALTQHISLLQQHNALGTRNATFAVKPRLFCGAIAETVRAHLPSCNGGSYHSEGSVGGDPSFEEWLADDP